MTKSLFIGSTIIRLERVDSSNNYARTHVRDKMPIEGTVIVVGEQTAGRGQRSNSWVTEPKKNLTCSFILRPVFLAAKDQFLLSAAVALAVSDTVFELLPDKAVEIKWPNDVLVDGKKIAGILIENTLRGINLENSIIGIGLNVNQVEFPSGINATSVQLISEQETDLETVLQLLNSYLEKYYLQLREGRFEHILHQLNTNLFGVGNDRNLTVNGTLETVSIIGVRHTGELELERANGSRTLHQHHEIGWNM
ncbi:MAG: biotin--[acetyl-CoA-carboxylase] ligase [Flavobacteriales bacterium]|nr:biotin--[acetyl-CoA-carboxylase] ligase [Flavobacteriales bacterium]